MSALLLARVKERLRASNPPGRWSGSFFPPLPPPKDSVTSRYDFERLASAYVRFWGGRGLWRKYIEDVKLTYKNSLSLNSQFFYFLFMRFSPLLFFFRLYLLASLKERGGMEHLSFSLYRTHYIHRLHNYQALSLSFRPFS